MLVAGLKAQLVPDPGGNAITHDVDPHAFQMLCNRHAVLGGHLADSSLKQKVPLPTTGKGTSSAVPARSTHPSAPSTWPTTDRRLLTTKTTTSHPLKGREAFSRYHPI